MSFPFCGKIFTPVEQPHKQLLAVKVQLSVAVDDVQLLVTEQVLVPGAVNDTGEDILEVGDIVRHILWVRPLAGSEGVMLRHLREEVSHEVPLLLGGGSHILVSGGLGSCLYHSGIRTGRQGVDALVLSRVVRHTRRQFDGL